MRSEGRFPATNTALGTSWGARLPESPQEGLCLLKHLKGVLVEFPLQGGAREGESAPTKLWVTTKPAEAAEPSDALSRGSRPSQRVCVLFIQAKRGYSFQPVREMLGYVTLGMKKMRLLFFFFFSWRKVLRNSPETAFGFHGHSCPPEASISQDQQSERWALGLGLGLGEARGELVDPGPSPYLQLPPPPSELIRAVGTSDHRPSAVIPELPRSNHPEAFFPPSHTLMQP